MTVQYTPDNPYYQGEADPEGFMRALVSAALLTFFAVGQAWAFAPLVASGGEAIVATAATVETVTTTAVGVCGGDCSDDVNAAEQFLKTGVGNNKDAILNYLKSQGVKIHINPELPDAGQYLRSSQWGKPGDLFLRDPNDMGTLGHVHFFQHKLSGFNPYNTDLGNIFDDLQAYWWQLDHAAELGYSDIIVSGLEAKIQFLMNQLVLLEP